MLRVVTGTYDRNLGLPKWLTGKADLPFDRRVTEEWLQDDIIKQELRDVDHIVKIDGLMLTRESGRRIPVN